MKTCFKCKETKELSNFYRKTKALDGYQAFCKPCSNRHSNNRVVKKEQRQQYDNTVRRFKRYGLTKEIFDRMLEAQNSKCKICLENMLVPNIDHCHATNKVRGILCSSCNLGLGKFKDNPELLRRAANYLRDEG